MVSWLIFRTELARVPDEIELMKVVSVDTPRNGPIDYYVFRFRTYPPHWQPKTNGWLVFQGLFSETMRPARRKSANPRVASGAKISM